METNEYDRQKIDEYRSWCRRFTGLWRSLVVRLAWTRVADIEMVAHLHASLEVPAPQDIAAPPYDPSLENYNAEFHVLPARDLDRLLDELAKGSLTIGGRRLAVGGFTTHKPDEFRRLDSVDSGFLQRHEGHWLANPESAEAHLRATSHNIYEATQRLLYPDVDMKPQWNALPAPFRDIDDVLACYFGLRPEQVQSLRLSAFAAFRAPVPIFFTDATGLDGKHLRIEVRAPDTTDREAVAVGLIENTGAVRRTLALDSWEREDSCLVARLSLPATDLHTYTLYLAYKDACLETKEDSNPALRPSNPVLAAHRLFERSPDFTKQALRGEGKDPGRDFERAVGWLLYACGLPALDYSAFGRDEIDLVVILPEKRLAVCVECTTGLPDLKNKLTKVYERSERLTGTLDDFEVIRAVATCSDNEIPEDQIKVAIGHGTALLTRGHLLELEGKAHSKVTTSETVSFINGCIPIKDDEIGAAVRKARGLFEGRT